MDQVGNATDQCPGKEMDAGAMEHTREDGGIELHEYRFACAVADGEGDGRGRQARISRSAQVLCQSPAAAENLGGRVQTPVGGRYKVARCWMSLHTRIQGEDWLGS